MFFLPLLFSQLSWYVILAFALYCAFLVWCRRKSLTPWSMVRFLIVRLHLWRSLRRQALAMRLLAHIVALGCAIGWCHGSPAAAEEADPWSCPAWIAVAERAYGIPPQFLQAIGRVEAGDAIDQGRAGAWIMNVNGRAVAPRSLAEALDNLILFRSQPSVDVGCLQINLQAHGNAVPAPGWLFYPKYNAAYGGWYLATLFRRYGSWGRAVAAYHAGRDAEKGRAYCRRVVLALRRAEGNVSSLDC